MPGETAAPGVCHAVVMGVSGCGKSEVGRAIAARLGLALIEGDDFHPKRNIHKMQQGIALTDDDRADWLLSLGRELAGRPRGAVLTCSALKRAYRDTLRAAVPSLRFVHLSLTQDDALRRVAQRTDHFYPPSLVASQFEALQDPAAEAGVLQLDATAPVASLANAAAQWLQAAPGSASG